MPAVAVSPAPKWGGIDETFLRLEWCQQNKPRFGLDTLLAFELRQCAIHGLTRKAEFLGELGPQSSRASNANQTATYRVAAATQGYHSTTA